MHWKQYLMEIRKGYESAAGGVRGGCCMRLGSLGGKSEVPALVIRCSRYAMMLSKRRLMMRASSNRRRAEATAQRRILPPADREMERTGGRWMSNLHQPPPFRASPFSDFNSKIRSELGAAQKNEKKP
jgi:hypothetical protein